MIYFPLCSAKSCVSILSPFLQLSNNSNCENGLLVLWVGVVSTVTIDCSVQHETPVCFYTWGDFVVENSISIADFTSNLNSINLFSSLLRDLSNSSSSLLESLLTQTIHQKRLRKYFSSSRGSATQSSVGGQYHQAGSSTSGTKSLGKGLQVFGFSESKTDSSKPKAKSAYVQRKEALG